MPELQINVRADLFRIAYHAVSTEETRYYLNGVFVEPHVDGGVVMTSTDGHRLISVYDRAGEASASAIVKLPADAIKACKPGKGDVGRFLKIKGNEARIVTIDSSGAEKPVSIASDFVIDGTFPDWRRVLPRGPFTTLGVAAFNAAYFQGLSGLAKDIAPAFDRQSVCMKSMTISASDPALVLFPGAPDVFAVLMPVKEMTDNALPAFTGVAPEAAPIKKRKAA